MSEEIKTGQSQIQSDNGEEKQPEAMPTSNKAAEVTDTLNKDESLDGVATLDSDSDELDESVKERTRQQFEKLKAEKAELKKQLEEQQARAQNQNLPSVLDILSSDTMPQEPVGYQQWYAPMQVPNYQFPNTQNVSEEIKKVQKELVDADGYVNSDVLQERLRAVDEVSKRAAEAERKAMEAEYRIAKFEQDAETKALYDQYPELNPLSTVFSQDAYDLVRNELQNQIIKSGKRDSFGAAAKMSKYFRQPQKAAQPSVVTQQRAQISVPGNMPRQNSEDLNDLRLRSRKDPSAVAERMKRLGI